MSNTAAKPQQASIKTAVISLMVVAILGAMAYLAHQLIELLDEQQAMSIDVAEMDDVRYGLLNANVWVEHVTYILEKKIREFDLGAENRAAIKRSLSRMLDTLITEVDNYMRKQNLSGQTWWERVRGQIKQGVQNIFIDVEDIKTAIPEYADRILAELEEPEARDELNLFLRDVLSDLSKRTFSPLDLSRIEAIEAKYACTEWMFCRALIEARIRNHQDEAKRYAIAILALMLSLFVLLRLESPRPSRDRFVALAVGATMLMLCGVLTPMMDVEARISELRFVLLGEPVVFANQMLYFQSKSVLDMVEVLTSTGAYDMIAVGLLIMTFSVLFPMAKLASSVLWLYGKARLRGNPVVRFFGLKSCKWSMADVMVVAIFMAYIGFDGIIASQLSGFADATEQVDVLTTNGTSLELGFFMFLGFCLTSLLSAAWMESAITHSETPHEQ